MKAWRVHQHGAPTAALRLDEVDALEPGPGQVRVAVTHSVLNMNDIDGCHGRYRTVDPPLPYVAGMEVTGTVDAAGEGAEAWLGRRVVACRPDPKDPPGWIVIRTSDPRGGGPSTHGGSSTRRPTRKGRHALRHDVA